MNFADLEKPFQPINKKTGHLNKTKKGKGQAVKTDVKKKKNRLLKARPNNWHLKSTKTLQIMTKLASFRVFNTACCRVNINTFHGQNRA